MIKSNTQLKTFLFEITKNSNEFDINKLKELREFDLIVFCNYDEYLNDLSKFDKLGKLIDSKSTRDENKK